jgi:hypothetical protein
VARAPVLSPGSGCSSSDDWARIEEADCVGNVEGAGFGGAGGEGVVPADEGGTIDEELPRVAGLVMPDPDPELDPDPRDASGEAGGVTGRDACPVTLAREMAPVPVPRVSLDVAVLEVAVEMLELGPGAASTRSSSAPSSLR